MKQIDSLVEVQEIGGIKGQYYSLCEEVLLKGGKSKLPEYIVQNPETMLLDDLSLKRMDNLCHFSVPGRESAPMRNPSEWRKFDKILQDDDDERRVQLIQEVEDDKISPSDVWAKREVELYLPRWEIWLQKVSDILSRVQFGDDLESSDAKEVGTRLGNLLAELQKKMSGKSIVQNPTKESL